MAEVTFITDQHFGARNDSVQLLDFQDQFYNETFFPAIDARKIDTVFILGDTYDRRKYVNFYTFKRSKEMFFDKLKERNIKVIMLAGNHDTYFKNTNEVNSVELLLSHYDNITIISEPKTIEVNGNSYCMLPWICPDNVDRSLDEIENTTAKICLGHLEIAGFAMYRGMDSNEGFNRKLFGKFDHVFSGHYHHKSIDDNICYLGNPYQMTWQDYEDDRGFHLFDYETYDLTFVKNPNQLFFKIIYDDKVDSISDIEKTNLDKYRDTYVKLIIINKTNPYIFDRFLNRLYEKSPIDITIAEDFADRNLFSDEEIDQTEDTINIINKFVDTLENTDVDTTKLKQVMQKIYVQALNTDQ